jgi:type IV pilus assembly protein PilA
MSRLSTRGLERRRCWMFQRFHAMKEERDGGFTLIELLVVILIIAILAAIAIPVFLRQREKGWRSQMESAVKNAATAEESFLTSSTAYTTSTASLVSSEGLKYASDVTLSVTVSGGKAYCIKATHANLAATDNYYYHSGKGQPTTSSPGTIDGLACP